MTSEVQWQNYLNEVTDAILLGEPSENIRSRYGINYRDDVKLIDLIEQLDNSLVPVEPSKEFTNRLKDELMGVERTGVVWRIRRLPARVQWAAIVAALLGGVLIIIQRFMSASSNFHREERATLPDEG